MEPTATRVAAVRQVGEDAVAVDVETPEGFEARPGQFVRVAADVAGRREARYFTVSSPRIDDTFEITVEVTPDGTLGPWLAARDPGDRLELAGPYGHQHYDGEPRVVVLAGGPGVGPAVAVAERALAEGGEAAVVYLDNGLVHEPRLAALARAGASVFALSEEGSVAPAAAAVDPADGQAFVFGFAPFLDVATAALETADVDPGDAKVENFS